jgi:hypothetical protein
METFDVAKVSFKFILTRSDAGSAYKNFSRKHREKVRFKRGLNVSRFAIE